MSTLYFQCAYTGGCTALSCITACSSVNGTILNPFFGRLATLAQVNTDISLIATSFSGGLTGLCSPITCNQLCAAAGSALVRTAIITLAVAMMAASLIF